MVVPTPTPRQKWCLLFFFFFFSCQLFRRKMRTFLGEDFFGGKGGLSAQNVSAHLRKPRPQCPPPPWKNPCYATAAPAASFLLSPLSAGVRLSFLPVYTLLASSLHDKLPTNLYACRENVAYASRKSSYLIERHGNPYNFVTNSLNFVFVPCGFATKSLKCVTVDDISDQFLKWCPPIATFRKIVTNFTSWLNYS